MLFESCLVQSRLLFKRDWSKSLFSVRPQVTFRKVRASGLTTTTEMPFSSKLCLCRFVKAIGSRQLVRTEDFMGKVLMTGAVRMGLTWNALEAFQQLVSHRS